jgi:transposase
MPNTTVQFLNTPFDEDLWAKLFKQESQEYIRRKLRFVKRLWEIKDRGKVLEEFNLSYNTSGIWLNTYLDKGLRGLVEKKLPTTSGKQKLSPEQKQQLRSVIIEQIPTDYGFDRYIWTGEIICELVKILFDVELKDSRIYEILNELGLSHQKAHRDYDNADKQKQTEFQNNIKKNSKISKTWKVLE